MSGSKSKNKGNSFEREVSTFLSKLYNESFIKVPFSGAFIGGSNNHRKDVLSENQTKSFKGDIIPPDSWNAFNAEAKSYADFPFHQVIAGSCKQLNTWIGQLMEVADESDLNVLFMKFNRKGKFVALETKYTWIADNFVYYSSPLGDWIIVEFEQFFLNNKDLFKTYSSTPSPHQETQPKHTSYSSTPSPPGKTNLINISTQ